VAQVVKRLPSKYEVLSSNPNTTKKKRKKRGRREEGREGRREGGRKEGRKEGRQGGREDGFGLAPSVHRFEAVGAHVREVYNGGHGEENSHNYIQSFLLTPSPFTHDPVWFSPMLYRLVCMNSTRW
jgi:hypothetical protein